MSKLTELAGTPQVVNLKGTDYSLSPLTLGDWGQVDTWVENQSFLAAHRLLKAAGETAPEAIKEKIWADALAGAKQGISSNSALTTFQGTAFLMFLSLHHCHSGLTLSQVLTLVEDCELSQLQGLLDRVVGASDEVKNSPSPVRTPQ